jgi:hypothetical protein
MAGFSAGLAGAVNTPATKRFGELSFQSVLRSYHLVAITQFVLMGDVNVDAASADARSAAVRAAEALPRAAPSKREQRIAVDMDRRADWDNRRRDSRGGAMDDR